MVYSGKMDTPVIDQTQDSAPLSPTPMNAAFKIVIVLLVFSLLSVSLIFAYFFSQRKSWKVPEETMAPVASPMVVEATPDLMPDSKIYTVSASKYSLSLLLGAGGPSTTLSDVSRYKDGDFFVLNPANNKFFSRSNTKKCPEKVFESKVICILPGMNWYKSNDIEKIEVQGNTAFSYYLAEPLSNSTLHVVEFQKYPFQISTAVDGVGAEERFQKILATVNINDVSVIPSDWKTYTDPKITFQHPADWFIAPGQIISLTSYDQKVSTIPENGTRMEISQTTQTQNELETFVQQRLSDYSMSSFVSDPKLKAVSENKIGNLSTQEIVMQQANTSRYTQELYASLNSTETISVVVYNGASHGASIKQILSTFTFTK